MLLRPDNDPQSLIVFKDILRRLAEGHGTPFYLYSAATLRENLRALRYGTCDRAGVLYSMKANPHPEIVRLFVEWDCGLEVASAGELCQAKSQAASGVPVFFAGPGKTDDELAAAVEADNVTVQVESASELRRASEIAQHCGRRLEVGVRVNPSFSLVDAQIRMGGMPSQFGVDEEQVETILDLKEHLPGVVVVGLHFYAGTQVLSEKAVADYLASVGDVMSYWARKHDLRVLCVGCGLGVPCQAKERPLDMGAVRNAFAGLFGKLDQLGADQIRVHVEAGRYLVANAGFYVARVMDVKESRGKRFVVLDGGTNHIAMAGVGRAVRRNMRMQIIRDNRCGPTESAIVVGPLCHTLDRIGYEVALPTNTGPGDLLVVEATGAYGLTASPVNFLSHPWPAEFLVEEGGSTRCISPRIEMADLHQLRLAKLAELNSVDDRRAWEGGAGRWSSGGEHL